jgi:hypothetical protein
MNFVDASNPALSRAQAALPKTVAEALAVEPRGNSS